MASPGAVSANVLFSPFDVVSTGTLGLGSWRGGDMSIDRMKTDMLADFARTTDVSPSSTKVAVVLPKPVLSQCAAVIDHNCTTDARIRVTGYADAGLTETVDGADTEWVDMFPPYTVTEALPSEHPSWLTGRQTEEELSRFPRNWFHVFERPKFVHAWLYEFDNRYHPAGHLDVARLWHGQAFQPELNMAVDGFAFQWSDESSQIVRAPAGTLFSREGAVFRTASFSLKHLKRDEAYNNVAEMQRRLGTTRPFLLSLYPTVTQYLHLHTFFAMHRTLLPIAPTEFGRHSAGFEVWEQI